LKLGLDKVPVHVTTGLTPVRLKAYRLADNQTAQLSTWDYERLPLELAALQKTTTSLAKLYDRLTVGERLPLLVAAQARGDDTEYRRLCQTSPGRTWQYSEYLWDELALHMLALTYAGALLDTAAGYFFAR
jgi:hypothetical protein